MLVPVHRLFFALKPPTPQAAAIGRARDSVAGAHSIVSDDRLHATLAITNDYPEFPQALADRLVAIGDAVAGEPVPVALDRLVGSPRSVALRSRRAPAAMRDLQRQLAGPMARQGLGRHGWEFSPHVTLLYWQGKAFEAPADPIGWLGSDFVLIHSIVGRTRHIELARWLLEPRQYGLFH